jgi:signal transduction histidine kinase
MSFEYALPIRGEQVYFESRILPTDNEIVVVFARNITARKQTEIKIIEQNQLLEHKNDELTKINHELDSFIYRASHDLRAPLSSILGLAEIGLRTNDNEEMKSCLAMIKERVKVQDHVIHDIIEYARNLRTEINQENFNLKLLVFETIDMLLFNEGAEKIDFQTFISDDFEIEADKTRIAVILSNLLSNSVKYRDPLKENQFVKISAEQSNSQLNVIVEDNGIGIQEDLQSKIFTMFFRASEKSKGSGLGLYIVKDTIQKLEGHIEFKSTLGEGTKFIFSIPLKK